MAELEGSLSDLTKGCCNQDEITKYVHNILNNETSDFNVRLRSTFQTKNGAKALIEILRNDIQKHIAQVFHSASTAPKSDEEVKVLVEEALNKYDADKTGMFDFALETAGGTIASTRCTETYDVSNAVYSVWGVPIWWERNNPRTILQPGSSPGQCWAFRGSQGAVVVGLSGFINVKAVSLEHIPRMLAPDGNIKSAPDRFAVLGLSSVDDKSPVHLGNFTYNDRGNPVQTFYVRHGTERSFNLIELKILSNHGHMTYTCIYRFRVHGTYQGLEPKH